MRPEPLKWRKTVGRADHRATLFPEGVRFALRWLGCTKRRPRSDLFFRRADRFGASVLFARRIGLTIQNLVGTRLTVRIGATNVALLDVQQAGYDGIESKNLGIVRISQQLLEEPSVGMILTNGDPATVINVAFTPDLTGNTVVQYDNISKQVGVNSRIAGPGVRGMICSWW